MSKTEVIVTKEQMDKLRARRDADSDDIALPTHIRVEKDGKDTRVFCAVSGAEVMGIGTVKLDLSDGKAGKAKLTFECDVAEVIIVDNQIGLPFGE